MKQIILICTFILTSCVSVKNFEKYKPSGTGDFFGRDIGYKEKQVAPDKWLVTFNTGAYTKKDEAWQLLYRRVEEFGNLKCLNGYTINHQEIYYEYNYNSDVPITIANAIIECKK